jgi:hypothetical protein
VRRSSSSTRARRSTPTASAVASTAKHRWDTPFSRKGQSGFGFGAGRGRAGLAGPCVISLRRYEQGLLLPPCANPHFPSFASQSDFCFPLPASGPAVGSVKVALPLPSDSHSTSSLHPPSPSLDRVNEKPTGPSCFCSLVEALSNLCWVLCPRPIHRWLGGAA